MNAKDKKALTRGLKVFWNFEEHTIDGLDPDGVINVLRSDAGSWHGRFGPDEIVLVTPQTQELTTLVQQLYTELYNDPQRNKHLNWPDIKDLYRQKWLELCNMSGPNFNGTVYLQELQDQIIQSFNHMYETTVAGVRLLR